MRLDSGCILWCNNPRRETVIRLAKINQANKSPRVLPHHQRGLLLYLWESVQFSDACPLTHSLAGAPPQTRPGWGMEPAPERKGPGGAGKQQGGKAEQIHATRYQVSLTEGGEISREQRAEPIAESRASEPLYSGVHHARLNAAFRPVQYSTVGYMTQNRQGG